MLPPRRRRQPADRAPGVRAPPRGVKAGEGGHHVDVPRVLGLRRQPEDLLRVPGHPEAVPQPGEGGAGGGGGALQGVGRRAPRAQLVRHSGEEALLGQRRAGAGVEQDGATAAAAATAAGAEGGLRLAR